MILSGVLHCLPPKPPRQVLHTVTPPVRPVHTPPDGATPLRQGAEEEMLGLMSAKTNLGHLKPERERERGDHLDDLDGFEPLNSQVVGASDSWRPNPQFQ